MAQKFDKDIQGSQDRIKEETMKRERRYMEHIGKMTNHGNSRGSSTPSPPIGPYPPSPTTPTDANGSLVNEGSPLDAQAFEASFLCGHSSLATLAHLNLAGAEYVCFITFLLRAAIGIVACAAQHLRPFADGLPFFLFVCLSRKFLLV